VHEDNEAPIRNVFFQLLSGAGTVTWVGFDSAAFQILQAEHVNLLVLDLKMP